MAVSAAAVHDIVAKSSFKEASCFLDDAREPRNPCKSCPFGRKFVGANFLEAADTLLLEDEVVATDGDNEEIGVPIGFARRDKILDVILEIDWAKPDRREKCSLFGRKIGRVIALPVAVESYCFIVNGAQARGPKIGFHWAKPSSAAAFWHQVFHASAHLKRKCRQENHDVLACRHYTTSRRPTLLRRS